MWQEDHSTPRKDLPLLLSPLQGLEFQGLCLAAAGGEAAGWPEQECSQFQLDAIGMWTAFPSVKGLHVIHHRSIKQPLLMQLLEGKLQEEAGWPEQERSLSQLDAIGMWSTSPSVKGLHVIHHRSIKQPLLMQLLEEKLQEEAGWPEQERSLSQLDAIGMWSTSPSVKGLHVIHHRSIKQPLLMQLLEEKLQEEAGWPEQERSLSQLDAIGMWSTSPSVKGLPVIHCRSI